MSLDDARIAQERFVLHARRPRTVLVGGGAGIAVVVCLADRLRSSAAGSWKPLVLMGSEAPFPFRARPSSIIVAGMPPGCIACMPRLEEWGVASRLASRADFPGCFDGTVTELADVWMGSLGPAELAELEIFACGPAAMLEATAEVAERYAVPCQVSPEDFTRS